ncbi:inositol monophosphatase family protein [Mycobacterium sp. ITM-2016-00317]|uniref:inositol monophosphatase family protein n=1 Tax=Mycobacterium sp. ITM-2016-00317 TaxID=2099694 RepID=UPI00287F5230|nr:inositol monophosphatase family protein [Mycobacterium sp. ITM-2016-00317]WNG88063.1 inositol monophosphatase family protein [Mycobacterium sp. ITM-2016-00317]
MQRTLVSYLLMPRPKDLVKALLIPVAYAVGAAATGEVSIESAVRVVVVMAAVELLIYPARYQWNDIRGFVADQQHPDSGSRGRLPGPLSDARRNVATSGAVALLRLLGVVALVFLLPGLDLGGLLTCAVAGIFGVAFAYEWLRSRYTGQDGQAPPRLHRGLVLIWLVAGAGYAVRGLVGLALAVDLRSHLALTAWAAVTLWAYGVAFVTSRWAVEATAFATAGGDGRVRFEARGDQGREHLVVLARWLPERLSDAALGPTRWVPLSEKTPLTAPWNIAIMVAGLASAVTGLLLAGPASVAGCVAAAAVGLTVTALPVLGVPRARTFLIPVGALALVGCYHLIGCPSPAVALAPWVLITAAYLFFSSRSLYALGRPGRLTRAVRSVRRSAGRSVFGRQTWATLQHNNTRAEIAADLPSEGTELVDVARIAAAAGARVAMRWWAVHAQLEVQEKQGPRDLVSRADRETEEAIRAELTRLRPDDGVLGEEGGTVDGSSGIRWVIDPIDGTTSYLYGRSDWAVSVAAVRCSDGVIVAAAVCEPVLGKTTYAQRGQGTFCDGQRVTVNDVWSLDRALIEINLGRDDQRAIAGAMVHELGGSVRDLRRGGSAASALAHVATGRADGVWAPGLQPWDGAGGVLLVEEAGGSVGDLSGHSAGVWPASGDVLAASPALWAALHVILARVYVIRV